MIYYDITELINLARHSHKVTGIQRVILEGLKGTFDNLTPFFISPITHTAYICNNLNIDKLDDLAPFEHLWIDSEIITGFTKSNLIKYLKWYKPKSKKQKLIIPICLNLLKIPLIGHLVAKCSHSFLKKRFAIRAQQCQYQELKKVNSEDTLAIFGAVWFSQISYEKFFNRIDPKVKKVFLIYDLIPIYCPLVPNELAEVFSKYIPFAIKHADKFIVNSASCKNDLIRFAKEKELLLPEISIIHLAHKMPKQLGNVSNYLPPLRTRKLLLEKYILCVGSIESRKNHLNLLNLWHRYVLSEHYTNEKLVIAGKWLWDVETVHQFLIATANVYGSVFVIDNPDDQELNTLYANCHMTVYPSHYEGWGLPLGESLSYHKPCLHFDNSSLKEAGYNLTIAIAYPNYHLFYLELIKLIKDIDYYNSCVETIKQNYSRLREWKNFANDIKTFLIHESK